MFFIKHLLILREQIAPFDVDFAVKEVALDFSKMKTAAFGLLSKGTRLLSLSTNNAILEFLLEVSISTFSIQACLVAQIVIDQTFKWSKSFENR